MKHTINILLLLLFCASSVQAQRVVKDNINCTYGIKNEDGSWLVESQYTLIQRYNSGYFQITDIDGIGLMNPEGKMILPCEYDEIGSLDESWAITPKKYTGKRLKKINTDLLLISTKDKLHQVHNSRGIAISERRAYAHMRKDNASTILLYDYSEDGVMHTTYIDTAGNVLIPRMEGMISPFYKRQHSLISDGDRDFRSSSAVGNVGVINNKGEIVIPRQFHKAKLYSSYEFWFENKERKFGKMNLRGDTLLAPLYQLRNVQDRGTKEHAKWVISNDEGLLGIMTNKGKVLVEPTYDEIKLNSNRPNSESIWMVEKDQKKGLITSYGTVIIPAVYDRIHNYATNASDPNKAIAHVVEKEQKFGLLGATGQIIIPVVYDSIIPMASSRFNNYKRVGFIVRKDGKFGIINSDGEVILECTKERILRRGRQEMTIFMVSGLDIHACKFENGITIEPLTPFARSNHAHLYRQGLRILSFTPSSDGRSIIGIDTNNGPFSGNRALYTLHFPLHKSIIFFNRNGKKLNVGNVKHTSDFGDFTILIGEEYSKLISNSTGRIFATNRFTSFTENGKKKDRIWASTRTEGTSRWVLIDTLGRQVMTRSFESTFQLNSGERMITTNNNTGLLDTKKLKWVIRPNYACLWRITNDLYYAANKYAKRGILRKNGTYLLPMEYDSIGLVYASAQTNNTQEKTLWWIVKKGRATMLINNKGQRVLNTARIKSMLVDFTFVDTKEITAPNYAPTFPKLYRSESYVTAEGPPTLFINKHFRNPLYAKIKAMFDSEGNFCDRQNNIWGSVDYIWTTGSSEHDRKAAEFLIKLNKSCNCASRLMLNNIGNYHFTSMFSDSGAMTVGYRRINQNYGYSMPSVGNNYPTDFINIVSREGKVEFIELTDIFKTDSLLREEFIVAVQKRDDLDLDCSAPDELTNIIEGKFELSDKGVLLYLNGYRASQTTYNQAIDNPIINNQTYFDVNIFQSTFRSASATVLIPTDRLILHEETRWLGKLLYKKELNP